MPDDQALTGYPGSNQPVTEPVIEDADTSGGQLPKIPKLYAGKYKTPEEVERAYQEAERKMHEATSRASQLEQQLVATQQAMQPVQGPGMTEQEYRERIRESLENDPVGTISHMLAAQGQMTRSEIRGEMERQAAIDSFVRENPEYQNQNLQGALAFVINEVINKDPVLVRLNHQVKLNKAKELYEEFEGQRFEDRQKRLKAKEQEMLKVAAMESGQTHAQPGGFEAPKGNTLEDYILQRKKAKEGHYKRF